MPEDGSEITGFNINERLPLASVSKMFTSLFAISQIPITRKVYTQFYYNHIGGGVYDVHIQGGIEPYFNRESMQWLISKLNEVGVSKIGTLSFDENFKYLHMTEKAFSVNRLIADPNSKKKKVDRFFYDPVAGKNEVIGPLPAAVKKQLEHNSFIMDKYSATKAAAAKDGITLVNQLVFNPKVIKFVARSEFTVPKGAKKAFIASPDLLHMIKLMNWKSNNHAADKILTLAGGIEKFNDFFHGTMKFTEDNLKFVNGSGQNAILDGRLYNEATCTSVLRAVNGLKKNLEKQGSKLENALAVIGGDIGSTFSGKYISHETNLSVVAKTGTVGTNITLAGMISAKTGNHFFYYNVETLAATGKLRNGKRAANDEVNRSKNIIAKHLKELIMSKKFGGPNPIDYKIQIYDTEKFDDEDADEKVETIIEDTKLPNAADIPLLSKAVFKSVAPPAPVIEAKAKSKKIAAKSTPTKKSKS